jgi:hypothetical protein
MPQKNDVRNFGGRSMNRSALPVDNTKAQGNMRMEDEDDVIGTEDWRPTPAIFQWFLTRDIQLAARNINKLLEDSKHQPLTIRAIKDSCLHSTDCIERVLSSLVASGKVAEDKGKYLYIA